MTNRQSTPGSDHSAQSDTNVRKRVCKACDRCRLKKSKCDGANPCGRCRADNAICVFGERKKAHDKVYPKGYVEMLEQQQQWLVTGLQELYRRTRDGEGWPGEPLKTEANGHPLTHDLLTRLGALDQSKGERFEEDTEALQRDLWRQSQMQAQETSDDSSDVAYSPTAPNSGHFGGLNRPHMPPTPPSHSPTTCSQNFPNIKTEPSTVSPFSNSVPATPNSNPGSDAFRTSMPPSGHINPMALESGPWSVNGFAEDMLGPDYPLNFDDPTSGQGMFNRGVPPVNCLPPNMLFDPNDEFNQLFHQNPEIPSI